MKKNQEYDSGTKIFLFYFLLGDFNIKPAENDIWWLNCRGFHFNLQSMSLKNLKMNRSEHPKLLFLLKVWFPWLKSIRICFFLFWSSFFWSFFNFSGVIPWFLPVFFCFKLVEMYGPGATHQCYLRYLKFSASSLQIISAYKWYQTTFDPLLWVFNDYFMV